MAGMISEMLLKRLTKFALDCQELSIILPRTSYNKIYGRQLIRSSSSPAANYIEAIEASTSKEFVHRLKISRKETKESNYWLLLIKKSNSKVKSIIDNSDKLIKEGVELIKIFTSSILTSERNQQLRNK